MKNKDSQSRDDERLIKILNRIGRMYGDVRPGFAERIKQQIPENLQPRKRDLTSIKAIMNLRIGKLIAAAIIVGEVILLLSLFGGVDLADRTYKQGRFLVKYYLPPVIKKWDNLVSCLEKRGHCNESKKQITTIPKESTARRQREHKPTTGGPQDKGIENIDAETLVAAVEREAGPGRPLEEKQSAEWPLLKTGKVQDSTAQTNEQAVIGAIKSFGRVTGTYPSKLSILTVMKEFRSAYKTRKAGKAIPDRALADTTKKLEWLCEFYEQMLRKGKEPAYYGDKVKPGKANTVLMRWRLVTGEYRVIFADLQIETVTAEKLGQLEAAPLQ